MDTRELHDAYEAASRAYRQKTEMMLSLAQTDEEPEAFHAASVEVAALWERLCELRSLLGARLEAPRASHDSRTCRGPYVEVEDDGTKSRSVVGGRRRG